MKAIRPLALVSCVALGLGAFVPSLQADTMETVLELNVSPNGAVIPDFFTTEYNFELAVGLFTAVETITVQVAIQHQDASDLTISLISPMGTVVLLTKRPAFSGDVDYRDTIFADDTTTIDYPSIGSGTAPFTATFNPIQPLSTFANESPNGLWKLRILDDVLGFSGTIYRPGTTVNWATGTGVTQGTKITIVSVPEPASAVLLVAGAGLMLARRRA